MKRTILYSFWAMMIAGLACAGAQNASVPAHVALPEPTTMLICAAGLAFFKCVEKRVP
jgi:hypothetical protein